FRLLVVYFLVKRKYGCFRIFAPDEVSLPGAKLQVRSKSRSWPAAPALVTAADQPPLVSSFLSRGAVPPFFAGDWRAVVLYTLRGAAIVVVAVSGVASYIARHGTFNVPALYCWQIFAGCIIAALVLHCARVYTFASLRQRSRHLGQVALIWTITALIMIA